MRTKVGSIATFVGAQSVGCCHTVEMMAETTEYLQQPKHFPALDGVRFLAVAFVIVHHITRGSHTSLFLHLAGLQAGNGIGPTLFFVLSGALLTPVILNARDNEHRYRDFLVRRVLRIFPLYLAYLGAAIAATALLGHRTFQHMWVFGFFLQNCFLGAASNTGSVLPVYHLWTLAVQDQFYIFWPLVLWRCNSFRQMRRLCFIIIVASFAVRVMIVNPMLSPEVFGRILPARAGEMCLGALLAIDLREKGRLANLLHKSLLPVSAALGLWMWHGLNFLSPLGSTVGLQLMAFASVALIAGAYKSSTWTARILGSKLIALAGKEWAFAMYIFHPILLTLCMQLPIASKILRLAIFGVSTVAISSISYRFYETHFLRMRPGRSKSPRVAVAAVVASTRPLSIAAD
jgi:peptidoglycan/LPS O-acetylase OafA/YrhL